MGVFGILKKKKTNSRIQKYLIEFRFSGYAKKSIRELKQSISRNFGVTKRKIVPHITLVGPLFTNDKDRLIKEVRTICKQYDKVKFRLDGFDKFENRVIYVRINPSEELKRLRADLVARLEEFCDLSELDHQSNFTFHATLVMNDIQRKFDRIWEYLQTWNIPKMEQHVVRITIIKNNRILIEYDLMQKKIFDRSKSLDRKTFQKTLKKLEKMRDASEIEFLDVTEWGKIFLISDTHFDHDNIIRYCNRPFQSARQMNYRLAKNWNDTVGENDAVYFLGDMSYGRKRHPIDYWLGKLNGEIFYVRGNHDKDAITRATVIPDRYGILYCGHQFLLMHDPHRPFGYEGWIIHGDKHNNHLKEYPFINQKTKTVNVSSEVVNYTPINLDRVISLIDTGRNYTTIE